MELYKIMDEIIRVKQALMVTKSRQLTFQYGKHLNRLYKKVDDYCREHDLDKRRIWADYEKHIKQQA